MRSFIEIRAELGLKKFLDSPLGTLYFVPAGPRAPRVMVRHFDHELPPTLAVPYADLISATAQWVLNRPELEHLITVEQPIEVGRDFVARPHHTYHTSIRSYEDPDDAPEPPRELELMRQAVRSAMGKSIDPRDTIIETVLSRSLLEPTGKTYFSESRRQFVVVEPKMTPEDVERWTALSIKGQESP